MQGSEVQYEFTGAADGSFEVKSFALNFLNINFTLNFMKQFKRDEVQCKLWGQYCTRIRRNKSKSCSEIVNADEAMYVMKRIGPRILENRGPLA